MERIRLDDENKTITIEIEESNEKERLERYHILVEKIMEITNPIKEDPGRYGEADNGLISLNEWARLNGITPATARAKAQKGILEGALKIGNSWVIPRDSRNIDGRTIKKERRS